MNSLTQPKQMLQTGNLSENWKRSRQSFEHFACASGFATKGEKVKVNLLLHVLGEDCVDVYNTFEFENVEHKENLEMVLQKFEEHYNPKKNVAYERHLFFKYVQTTETIDQFVTELRKKAKNCEFGELMNSLIRDRLVAGVKDAKLQERLLRISDLTLDRALDVCRAAEATESQVKNIQEEKPLNVIQKHNGKPLYKQWQSRMPTQNNRKPTKPEEHFRTNSCGRCGKFHQQRSCPAYGKICHKCKGMNHFASQCKGKSSYKPVHEQNQRRVHRIEKQSTNNMFVGCVDKLENNGASKSDKWQERISVNGKQVEMKLDTGAQVNAMPLNIFENIRESEVLQNTTTKITAYGGAQIEVLGNVNLKCIVKKTEFLVNFLIVNANTETVLGSVDCERLGFISRLEKIDLNEHSLLKKYEDVFRGVGKIDKEYSIVIDKSVPPVVNSARKIPFKLMEKFKEELNSMEENGIISKVTYPTDWVHNVVIVEKPNGSLRICLDPKDLNKAVKREIYKIPTVEEIAAKVGKAKYFSVLDARSGFWQIPLSKESQDLCTFNTPYGRYKFLRMPFGINSAPEIFQRCMEEILEGLEGVAPYMDDIITWGDEMEQHDEHLEKALIRVRDANLKLNKEKTVIGQTEVEYVGHKFTKDGLKIDHSKVEAVQLMEAPKCKKDLERFLGMMNYLSRFIPNYSSETAVLRELTKADVVWLWQPAHELCFQRLKSLISSPPVLQFYDPKKNHKISADASEFGLGAVLLQEDKPVAYASRTLTSAERNYAQIEKEILAITFAAEKFHQYIYGNIVTVETDHKPLEVIFKKCINNIPPRVQRFRLRLQKYHLNVFYKPGKELYIADTLSRVPLQCNETDKELENDANVMVHSLLKNFQISDVRLEDFKKASAESSTLQILKQFVQKGWPKKISNVPAEIRCFWTFREEIHEIEGVFFKGDRLIVPKCVQKEMLELIHESHMGITKCKARARECLYWPGMSVEIEELVLRCGKCQLLQKKNTKEPLLPHEVPDRPWEKLGADLFELNGKHFLIIADYYSKYPEIALLHGLKSEDVITSCKSVFSRHGSPKILITDNGPQFASSEFRDFAKEWNFQHTTSSPCYPQSNGFIERNIQTVKKLLKKSDDPYASLLNYRNTPLMSVGLSPAQILMGRRLNTKLPMTDNLLKPQQVNHDAVKEGLRKAQNKQKEIYDRKSKNMPSLKEGDMVMMEGSKDFIPAKVVRKDKNPRSFIVESHASKHQYRRNRSQLIKTSFVPEENIGEEECDEYQFGMERDNRIDKPREVLENNASLIGVTRAGRLVRKPYKFRDYV